MWLATKSKLESLADARSAEAGAAQAERDEAVLQRVRGSPPTGTRVSSHSCPSNVVTREVSADQYPCYAPLSVFRLISPSGVFGILVVWVVVALVALLTLGCCVVVVPGASVPAPDPVVIMARATRSVCHVVGRKVFDELRRAGRCAKSVRNSFARLLRGLGSGRAGWARAKATTSASRL